MNLFHNFIQAVTLKCAALLQNLEITPEEIAKFMSKWLNTVWTTSTVVVIAVLSIVRTWKRMETRWNQKVEEEFGAVKHELTNTDDDNTLKGSVSKHMVEFETFREQTDRAVEDVNNRLYSGFEAVHRRLDMQQQVLNDILRRIINSPSPPTYNPHNQTNNPTNSPIGGEGGGECGQR